MGTLADLLGKRVYLDANVFIYAIEALPPWNKTAQRILQTVDAGGCLAVTSELTLAECLTRPFQLGQHENASVFERAIQSGQHLTVEPIYRRILIEAARFRAKLPLKLPDAIHAATALQTACAWFVTNDRNLRQLAGFQTMLLSEIEQ